MVVDGDAAIDFLVCRGVNSREFVILIAAEDLTKSEILTVVSGIFVVDICTNSLAARDFSAWVEYSVALVCLIVSRDSVMVGLSLRVMEDIVITEGVITGGSVAMINSVVISIETGDSDACEEYSVVLGCSVVPRDPVTVGVSKSGEIEVLVVT